MYRVTIDLNTDGDVSDAIEALKNKSGKELLSYAAQLGIVNLEEELDGASLPVSGASLHECTTKTHGSCDTCNYLQKYSIRQLSDANLDENKYFAPEQ